MTRFLPIATACSLVVCEALFAADPVVENVTARQIPGSQLVEITYDVADADGERLYVSVDISADGGSTFDVPALTFRGDVGEVPLVPAGESSGRPALTWAT